MTKLLEITGEDIAALEDDDLRALIGLLCEADYRVAMLSTKGITWGGHQDAKDGGLDVVVRDHIDPPTSSNVPRKSTGFQVKKPDMPRSAILNEMRPKGSLRSSIKSLIAEKGAYIIVCSTGSVSDTALAERKSAMEDAVKDEENHEDLYLDFLDRGRIATWVRSHSSLVLWVRNKIGKPLKGWRPYENWANPGGGLEEEYLIDDGLRLQDWDKPSNESQHAVDGLIRIRSELSRHGTSVRLTGLSGVGKTRFVQALFDTRIRERVMNPHEAVYTDMSFGPEPDPVTMANQLISEKSRAILIVDDCPPDLHRRLAQACSQARSTVSVITIEYDVRDDIPEERTSVYKLEPASEGLIQALVKKRFPHLGQVDTRTIAEFSGGNARVAIALANTVRRGETLSGFRTDALFKRLFWQRHDPSENLLVSAQVCALVYSFQGEDATSDASELRFLGTLIGKSGEDLFKDVAALKGRELVQSRGDWRAVLPHAIANKLARQALDTIPRDKLVNSFLQKSSERLIKSFTRRLSYLHDCEGAQRIVETWLEPEGWIGQSNPCLNDFGAGVLKNIAPVSPTATLAAIERAANGKDGDRFASRRNAHHTTIVRLLRHLAYDAALFERSVELIIRFSLTEDAGERHNSIRDVLQSLFYIRLSGTHAPAEMRAAIIEQLLDSAEIARQELGLLLLDAALETWHFSGSHEFEFGARPRDFGYYPRSRDEIDRWLSTFIEICTKIALSKSPIADRAKRLLSNKLRGLWTRGGMYAAIEEAAGCMLERGAWNDGWIAVRGIIRYDSKGFDEEIKERLFSLESLLKPQDLLEKARTFALSDQRGSFNLADDFDDNEPASVSFRKAEEATREIGIAVAKDPNVFQRLLPDIVATYNTRMHHFGQGLAEGADDHKSLFEALRNAVKETPPDKCQINVLMGFLKHLSEADSALFDATLDRLVNDDVLGEWFPILQTATTIDERGIERLHEALDLGVAPIDRFKYLAYGRNHEPISDGNLASLLVKILGKDGGISVVVEILNMRFHGSKEDTREYAEPLIDIARRTLAMQPFDREQQRRGGEDYSVATIAAKCLNGPRGADAAKTLASNLANAMFTHQTYAFDNIELLSILAELQPHIFLDELFGREDVEQHQMQLLFSDDFDRRENPVCKVPDDVLIQWCEEQPTSRYALAISAVDAFEESADNGRYKWRPIVYEILSQAPDKQAVLEKMARALWPSSGSGSRADILEKRSSLLLELQEHENVEVASWAKRYFARFQQGIENERAIERETDRDRNESFE